MKVHLLHVTQANDDRMQQADAPSHALQQGVTGSPDSQLLNRPRGRASQGMQSALVSYQL